MPWTYAKLLREIDREKLPRGAFDEFLRRRADAYDHLMQVMCEGTLNERQSGHAVRLLWSLRVYKDWEERNRFYNLIVQWANDERFRVRNEAVLVLISLTSQRKSRQVADTDKERELQIATSVAKRAIEMGLAPRREEWVKAMLDNKAMVDNIGDDN
jgi:hypothetical protein